MFYVLGPEFHASLGTRLEEYQGERKPTHDAISLWEAITIWAWCRSPKFDATPSSNGDVITSAHSRSVLRNTFLKSIISCSNFTFRCSPHPWWSMASHIWRVNVTSTFQTGLRVWNRRERTCAFMLNSPPLTVTTIDVGSWVLWISTHVVISVSVTVIRCNDASTGDY